MATPTGDDRLMEQLGQRVMEETSKFCQYLISVDKTLGSKLKSSKYHSSARQMLKKNYKAVNDMILEFKRSFGVW